MYIDTVDNQVKGVVSWADTELEGRAHLFLLSEDLEKFESMDNDNDYLSPSTKKILNSNGIDLDLLITGANFQYGDFNQLDPHIGDTFSHHFYGKSPITMNISASLIDTAQSIGKTEFMELYTWLFRLRRVARTGISPYISFIGCTAQGAMLGLNVTESSSAQDILNLQFSFLVFNMRVHNSENDGVEEVEINYSTGYDDWLEAEAISEQDLASKDPDEEINIIRTA